MYLVNPKMPFFVNQESEDDPEELEEVEMETHTEDADADRTLTEEAVTNGNADENDKTESSLLEQEDITTQDQEDNVNPTEGSADKIEDKPMEV